MVNTESNAHNSDLEYRLRDPLPNILSPNIKTMGGDTQPLQESISCLLVVIAGVPRHGHYLVLGSQEVRSGRQGLRGPGSPPSCQTPVRTAT